ncbi:hypothetical protein CVT24_008483 [Panaeolus cyanescens]|uniref:Uncharacterized protein n=1 Tax=Panaeolus cyanescens TaxID=181874 RepID=A0A409YJF9_9AGAR|nr:hypothetical protein CVT24_008483 [Panaeolus cyanescens]
MHRHLQTYEHRARLESVPSMHHLRRFSGMYYPATKAPTKTSVLARSIPNQRRIVYVEDHFPPTDDEYCYPQYSIAMVFARDAAGQLYTGKVKRPRFLVFYQHDLGLPNNKYVERKFDVKWPGPILVVALGRRTTDDPNQGVPRGLGDYDVVRWQDSYDQWTDEIVKGLVNATEMDEGGEMETPRNIFIHIPRSN